MQNLEPFTIETLLPDLTRAWSADQSIVVFTLTRYSREVIDTWLDEVASLVKQWPGSGSRRLMYHFAAPFKAHAAVSFASRENRFRTEIYNNLLAFRIALIFPNAFTVNTARVLEMRLRTSASTNLQMNIEFFIDKDAGLEWLLNQPS